MNTKLFRGSLDTILIKLLSDQGEMYGYEMARQVEELTQGAFKLTEGALYPALHRLEARGVLTTEVRQVANRQRKYYRLTESGQKEVQSVLDEMQGFIASLQLILQPKTT